MFSGSIVAIITPMNDDGSLDKTSLKRLVNYHVNSGTSAIIAMGTTGESATFEHNEKRDTVRRVIDYADGNIPVIAGVSANSTAKAVSLTQNLEELEVAGCLSVTPYYNKPTQEGLYQHYKTIAENSSLSQILYNVPSRTGCDLLPETVGRLAKIKGIVALKDATGDLRRVYSVRRVVGDDFSLLSGDDATFLDFMVLGGNGTVSVTANIAAREMATICELALNHRTDEARKINDDLLALHNALFIEPNPVPVKWAAMQLGLAKTSKLRLPLTSLSDISKPIVEKALKMAKLV